MSDLSTNLTPQPNHTVVLGPLNPQTETDTDTSDLAIDACSIPLEYAQGWNKSVTIALAVTGALSAIALSVGTALIVTGVSAIVGGIVLGVAGLGVLAVISLAIAKLVLTNYIKKFEKTDEAEGGNSSTSKSTDDTKDPSTTADTNSNSTLTDDTKDPSTTADTNSNSTLTGDTKDPSTAADGNSTSTSTKDTQETGSSEKTSPAPSTQKGVTVETLSDEDEDSEVTNTETVLPEAVLPEVVKEKDLSTEKSTQPTVLASVAAVSAGWKEPTSTKEKPKASADSKEINTAAKDPVEPKVTEKPTEQIKAPPSLNLEEMVSANHKAAQKELNSLIKRLHAPVVEVPEGKAPEGKAPEVEAPEVEAPEVEAPEVEAPEVEAPEGKAPEGKASESNVMNID